jgi:hypothetical protein
VGTPSPSPSEKARQNPPPLWSNVYGGTQLAVSVLAGFGGGYYLDRRWDCAPWLTLAGSALGLGAGLYVFLKPYFEHADRRQ